MSADNLGWNSVEFLRFILKIHGLVIAPRSQNRADSCLGSIGVNCPDSSNSLDNRLPLLTQSIQNLTILKG